MPMAGSFRAFRLSKTRSWPPWSTPLSRKLLPFCIVAACGASSAFAQDAPAPFAPSWVALAIDSAVPEPREPKPDYTREIERNKSYAIPAAEILAFQFLLNRFDNAYFGCCDYRVTMDTIRRNLSSSWGVYRDP